MNWGWGNNPNNKNYYQVAGEWVTSDNINEDLSFQYCRNMITGFAKNKTYERNKLYNFISFTYFSFKL